MRKYLYSRRVSNGARALARALGIRMIKREGSKYKPRRSDIIVNWGNSTLAYDFSPATVWNIPEAVALASNKLEAYVVLESSEVPIPQYTTDRKQVEEWLSKGYVVVARMLLRASEGRGIVLIHQGDTIPHAPLYTLYRKKREEYRIHVFKGRVFDQQQKRRSTSDGRWQGDNRIRNSAGGWVFAREDVHAPRPVLEAATKAVGALGLDFGAADCGYSVGKDSATVYEVNTAAGLTGTTLEQYRRAFRGG
jgi:glutathione synthase/RimK-type ligase-like ATP-grasp enzyme